MGLFYYYTCDICCQVKTIKYIGDDIPPLSYPCSCGELLVRVDYVILKEKPSIERGLNTKTLKIRDLLAALIPKIQSLF